MLAEELKIWHTRVASDEDKDLGSIDDNVLAVCNSLAGRDKVATNNLLLRLSGTQQTHLQQVVRRVLMNLSSPSAVLLLRRSMRFTFILMDFRHSIKSEL